LNEESTVFSKAAQQFGGSIFGKGLFRVVKWQSGGSSQRDEAQGVRL
jgi:hypothetical protein